MATILVTGATGFVGGHVVTALRAAGHRVRCASRAPDRARATSPELEWVELDLQRPETLEPALGGCDAAVFLVHSMGPHHGEDYPEQERAGAEAFARAAGAAGVRRIVYLGGVIPSTGASRHLRSRQRTGEVLRAGPVVTIELRAAMVIGKDSASWMMVRDLSRRLPAMVLPRWLRNTSFPIAIDDVVHGIVAALALPEEHSRVYELPGPERLSHREVLILAAEAMGRRRLLISVPILTPRLSSYWIALVTRTSLAMAKELVEGVRENLEPTGESLWDRIDHRPMPIVDAIRLALGPEPLSAQPATVVTAPHHERRALFALAIATIGFSIALALRDRLDPWRTTALAAAVGSALGVWALGPRARALFAITGRGAVAALALGGVLVAATHGAYRVATLAFPELAVAVGALYTSIDGPSTLALAPLTALVVLGEEIVWRGVAVDLFAHRCSKRMTGGISVVLYLVPQVFGGVPLLVVAATLLGSLFAAQRLVTGRLTDALLTHVVWSVSVFVVFPLA